MFINGKKTDLDPDAPPGMGVRQVAASSAQEGLTEDERADFLMAIERVRQRGYAYLKECHNADDAIKFIGDLHRAVDVVFQRESSSTLKPACKVGCSHCCRLRVEIIDAEAFRIAEALQRRSPAEQVALIARLRHHTAVPKPSSSHHAGLSDCAFLHDSRCSIYAVRPSVCRKAHSLSAELCHAAAPQLPQNFRLIIGAEALMSGVSAAYREAGLPSASRELCAAVLLALTDDTAKARWYAGISVFAD